MTTEPIDPAAIMAQHFSSSGILCDNCEETWPCLPYRLAAENAALRERVRKYADQRREAGEWWTADQIIAALAHEARIDLITGRIPPSTEWADQPKPGEPA